MSRVRVITQNFSLGVANENEVNKEFAEKGRAFIDQCNVVSDYFVAGDSTSPPEYRLFLRYLPARKLKILDIGVGLGASAAFLASLGHRVYSIEPSLEFCETLDAASDKFHLEITPICAVGEEIDRIGETDFDAVFFNASLHHCDDPALALRLAYQALKPGAPIFLSSETHIRPWVSKKKWYGLLESDPVKFAHYGGNEHAYYTWEYVSMLRQAGFERIQRQPSALYTDALARIEVGITRRVNGARCWGEGQLLFRVFYYIVMARLVRLSGMFRLLSWLSIIPTQFVAVKPLTKGEHL